MPSFKRKPLRLQNHDYSNTDMYFVTICVKDREKLLWKVAAGSARQQDLPELSDAGLIADLGIRNISSVYQNVYVENYCIMADHVHIIIAIETDKSWRAMPAATLSQIIQQYKGWVSKQIGHSIWQKSFYDHILRDEKDYQNIWDYVDTNPSRY